MTNLIAFLVIGLIAGWLAGMIMKGKGFGILVNMVVGVIGAFIGGFVISLVGFSAHTFIGSIITATIGAILLIYIVRLIK